ncbi:hypothetical protein [Nocardia sp. NPDC049149]|uniref:hypothetical protein n=1 Tax=Nocardia sp. NPDC049149 TaxID=3364315 RepID=UPI003716D5AF
MEYRVSAADRAAFKRCRRQWDFAAAIRRSLRPRRPATFDLDRAVRDALAVYYFPGMWDWASTIVLPLVGKALDDSLGRQRAAIGVDRCGDAEWQAICDRAHLVVERYFGWAPMVDRFSPIRVETDFDAVVPDPAAPERGLVGPGGGGIHYTGRIDLLAIDAHDRYWIVRHRVLDEPFPPTEQLLLDEDSVTGCWAWSRFYDGMEVAGTIYNELSASPSGVPMPQAERRRGGIPQHEPSGGGRGVSSPRRAYVRGRPAESTERIDQTERDGLRRTVIRRDAAEIRSAGAQLAAEVLDMISVDVRVYPNPVPAHCSACAFVAPCLAVHDGRPVEPLLASDYRPRPAIAVERGRLGGTPFGVGRGWVPGREE